jgi:hypothetical protein
MSSSTAAPSAPPLSRPTTITNDNTEPTAEKPPSLTRPTRITNRRSSGGSSATLHTTANQTNHPRPTSLAQRSQTTGGAHIMTTTTNSACSPRPASMQSTERSHTTGIMADSAQLQAVSRRRSQYFGSARKQAWGNIFGVDPSWLERRSSVRRMEPIVELTTPNTTAWQENDGVERLEEEDPSASSTTGSY